MSYMVIMRHGESEANVQNCTKRYFCGQSESPLTECGQQQALAAGEMLKKLNVHFQFAVSSTQMRARETARIALAQLDYDVPLTLSDGLRERSLGIFEGKFADEIFVDYPAYKDEPEYRDFFLHFEQKAPGGENLTEVVERVRNELRKIENNCMGNCIIFSHSTTIRCILAELLSLQNEQTIRLEIPCAHPIILERTHPNIIVDGIKIPPALDE